MLKRTVKIFLCLLLHVSVQLDHLQGAYADPCQSYIIKELISENTSLYDKSKQRDILTVRFNILCV